MMSWVIGVLPILCAEPIERKPTLTFRAVPRVMKLAFSPTGKRLVTVDDGGRSGHLHVRVWDPTTGKQVAHSSARGVNPIDAWAFSGNGKYFAVSVSGFGQGELHLWDVDKGKHVWTKRLKSPSYGNQLAFTPDGKQILCARNRLERFSISTWTVATGKAEKEKFLPVNEMLRDPWVLSSQGRLLVTNHPGKVVLWETSTGKEIRAPETRDKSKPALPMLSKDERSLLTRPGKGFTIWDVKTGKARWSASVAGPTWIAFSNQGRALVLATKDRLSFWDVKSGKKQRVVAIANNPRLPKINPRDNHQPFAARYWALSPDGTRLAVVSGKEGDRILLWDVSKRDQK